MNNKKYGLKGF